jgi:hypothetical protein
MAEEVKKDDDWMQKKWRPAMGWMYMIICMLDMAVFPVVWSLTQVITKQPITQWNPLTLQGAGLFHLAMGAVLGIAAWGRTQEKVAGAAINVSTQAPAPTPTPAPVTPAPVTQYSVAQTPIPTYTPQYQQTTTTQTTTYDQPIYIGGRLAPPSAPQPLL